MKFCIICNLGLQGSSFSCILCEGWAHLACAGDDDDMFVCPKCDKRTNLNDLSDGDHTIVSDNLEVLNEEVVICDNIGDSKGIIIHSEKLEDFDSMQLFDHELGGSFVDAVSAENPARLPSSPSDNFSGATLSPEENLRILSRYSPGLPVTGASPSMLPQATSPGADVSSINSLLVRTGMSPRNLLAGDHSLRAFFETEGYSTIPLPRHPSPGEDEYFSGDWTTQNHESRDGGEVGALIGARPGSELAGNAGPSDTTMTPTVVQPRCDNIIAQLQEACPNLSEGDIINIMSRPETIKNPAGLPSSPSNFSGATLSPEGKGDPCSLATPPGYSKEPARFLEIQTIDHTTRLPMTRAQPSVSSQATPRGADVVEDPISARPGSNLAGTAAAYNTTMARTAKQPISDKLTSQLIAQLQEAYPNLSAADAKKYILEVRSSNKGMLSGLSIHAVMRKVDVFLKRDNGGFEEVELNKCKPKKTRQAEHKSEVNGVPKKKGGSQVNKTETKKKKTLAEQTQMGDESFPLHIKSEFSDELNRTVYTCQSCSKFQSSILLKARKHAMYHEKLLKNMGKTKQNKSRRGVKWACSACDFQTVKKVDMNKHFKKNHAEPNSFICPDCGHSFKSHKILKRHIGSVHGDKKKVSCNYCDLKCKDNHDLKKHVRRKHEKPQDDSNNLPNVVNKTSFHVNNNNVNVNHDINIIINNNVEHINDKKEPKFTCTICSKSFVEKKKLNRHEKQHNPEKLPKCDFCNKSFRDNTNLRNHMKKHDKVVTKYACNFCKKSYAKENALVNHIKRDHKKHFDNNIADICNDSTNELIEVDNVGNSMNDDDAFNEKIVTENKDISVDNVAVLNNDFEEIIVLNNDFDENTIMANALVANDNSSNLPIDDTIFFYVDSDEINTKQNADDNSVNTITCKICDSILANKFNLQRHILEMHTPKILKCGKCQGIFSDKMAYTLHTPCKWTCLSCHKTFVKYSFFIKHTNNGICT